MVSKNPLLSIICSFFSKSADKKLLYAEILRFLRLSFFLKVLSFLSQNYDTRFNYYPTSGYFSGLHTVIIDEVIILIAYFLGQKLLGMIPNL